ncbi:MAG TPA: helix-turn-helix domain-containing protein [Solirubrobacter sp.]|nr:helix-turn-helix domain-containing protein [Solirubrobacter sp.]
MIEEETPRLGVAAAFARVAVSADGPQELVEHAAPALGRALALAGPAGEPLAVAPRDASGARALAIATGGEPEPGWRVLAVSVPGGDFGRLAVGPPPNGGRDAELIELLRTLLASQLERARLRDHERAAGRAPFVRRLVRPGAEPRSLERDAAELGIQLAGAYRPALLVWHAGPAPAGVRAALLEALRRDAGALGLPLEDRLLLLHPHRGEPREGWLDALEALVATVTGDARVQAIAGRRALAVAELPAGVQELLGLGRVVGGGHADGLVIRAERFGLERLLRGGLDARTASAFVDAQLGELIAWDSEHGDDLLGVVEAALECARYDEAARRCSMHRNTFRHRLQRATELLGEPFVDPEQRLALHVALKLRRLLGDHANAPPRIHPRPAAARPASIEPAR